MFPTTADTPRIVRVTITRSDGSRRRRLVKCPFPQSSPNDSVFGLQAKLAELTLAGSIVQSSTSVPATLTPKQRDRLTRWPAALAAMLA